MRAPCAGAENMTLQDTIAHAGFVDHVSARATYTKILENFASHLTRISHSPRNFIIIITIVILTLSYAYFSLNTPMKYPIYIDDIKIIVDNETIKAIDFNDNTMNDLTALIPDSYNPVKIVEDEYHSPPNCLAFMGATPELGQACLKLGKGAEWHSFEASWYLYKRGDTSLDDMLRFCVFFAGGNDLGFDMRFNFFREIGTQPSTMTVTTMYYNYSRPVPLSMYEKPYYPSIKVNEWQKVSILFSKEKSTFTLMLDDKVVFTDIIMPEFVTAPQELRWIG